MLVCLAIDILNQISFLAAFIIKLFGLKIEEWLLCVFGLLRP